MPTDVRPVTVGPGMTQIPDGKNPVETISNSGSSQQSTASLNVGQVWEATADGTAVRVICGSNPTATSASIPVLAGTTRWFHASPGDKIAVINL